MANVVVFQDRLCCIAGYFSHTIPTSAHYVQELTDLLDLI